jgi:hypothetical protein
VQVDFLGRVQVDLLEQARVSVLGSALPQEFVQRREGNSSQ